MMMKARQKRLVIIVAALLLLVGAGVLIKMALNEGAQFFYSPTEVVSGKAPQGKTIRVGGLVEVGSLKREADGVTVGFRMTDTAEHIEIRYKGILPDLFKEGKGAIVLGTFTGKEVVASEVLAKHDENYMPPEAQKAVDDAHKGAKSAP